MRHFYSSPQPHNVTAPSPLQVISHLVRPNTGTNQEWSLETHSSTCAPELSTHSYLSNIVAQPLLSSLCCPRPPPHHGSNIISVCPLPTLHFDINSSCHTWYSSIHSAYPNHLNTNSLTHSKPLLLLANSLSIPTLPQNFSNASSQEH